MTTITLTEPLQYKGREITELTIRKATAADFVKCERLRKRRDVEPEAFAESAFIMVEVLTGQPNEVVGMLCPDDFLAAMHAAIASMSTSAQRAALHASPRPAFLN